MKRNILGTAIACLLLSSCASPNLPDQALGNERGPDDGRLAGMAQVALERDMRDQQRAHASERTGLMQKVQEMGSELADLKGRLTASQSVGRPPAVSTAPAPPTVSSISMTPSTTSTVTPVRPSASSRAGKPAVANTKVAARTPPITGFSRANRETIVIQDKGMIFRVMHGFARTEFHPSKSLQQQLLQAARAGKRIEIRGRTDASTANDGDRDIAMRRALNARVFLANNGIHPRKMHINYMAAGDNVADNSTADGRARNRRVEIETAGITADVLEDLAAVIRQDLQ